MKNDITVPALGESVVEARIAHWLKKEGAEVEVGDALVELETEKVNVDVTSETSGVLTKIMAREEDTVHIGDIIGEIESKSAMGNPPPPTEEPQGQVMETGTQITEVRNESRGIENEKSNVREVERATPVARKVAEEEGLKLSRVGGTGSGGRVTKRDVESFLKAQTEKSMTKEQEEGSDILENKALIVNRKSEFQSTERIKMSLRRKTIARRMLEAQQTTAMLTTFNEIDMSRVVELRKKYKDQFQQRTGVGLGIVSFFVKASIAALREFPRLNAEIDGDDIIYKHYYDIGVAIAAQEGLVVPVLRNADAMSFAEIEAGIKNFAEKSKSGSLTLEDLRGGTFTISNGGVFGSLMSTPILNPPQVGILGLHKIVERPVVENGQIVAKPMMYVALTYDHRIVDGSESVQFLVRVKEFVEDPAAMVIE